MTMLLVPWTVTLKAANGVHVTEFDCSVECEVVKRGDEPELSTITAIFVESPEPGVRAVANLVDSDSGLAALGELSRTRLLADEAFQARAIELAGWVYRSRGGNDPWGYWKRAG